MTQSADFRPDSAPRPPPPDEHGGNTGIKIIIIVLVLAVLCCVTSAASLVALGFFGVRKGLEVADATMRPVMEMEAFANRARRENPWKAADDDTITADRLDVYLAVREQAMRSFEENVDAIEKVDASGSGPGFGEMADILKRALSVPRDWTAALVEHGMSPEEFFYLTDQVYRVWYAKREDEPEHAEGYRATIRREFLGANVPDPNAAAFEAARARIDGLAEPRLDVFLHGNVNVR